MSIFDPIMWPLIGLMILATQPITYVAIAAGFGVFYWRKHQLSKTKGPHTFGGPANGLGSALVVREGEFSSDGGKTWIAGDEVKRLMEADQFGGFDRTPRYRHSDK